MASRLALKDASLRSAAMGMLSAYVASIATDLSAMLSVAATSRHGRKEAMHIAAVDRTIGHSRTSPITHSGTQIKPHPIVHPVARSRLSETTVLAMPYVKNASLLRLGMVLMAKTLLHS
jgi:hypothetical protein